MDHSKKLSEQRQQLVNEFVRSLEQNELPWSKGWNGVSGIGSPVNAVSNKRYRGVNNLYLWFKSMQMGYTDGRWVTLSQANEQGWRVNKGEKSSPVEYWELKYYDKESRRTLTRKVYESLIAQGRNRDDFEPYMALVSVWHVFNLEQCSQIVYINKDRPDEKLPKKAFDALVKNGDIKAENYEIVFEQIPRQTFEEKDINSNEFIENLISKIGVGYMEEAGNDAYYSSKKDCVVLPLKSQFKSNYEYNATKLHEVCHSTGHSTRLNRDMTGFFGTESYAREELRAEIGSAFIMQHLGLSYGEEHLSNHKAYVQNWISVLKKEPQELFKAIEDATKIENYCCEKGEIDKYIQKETAKAYMNLHVGDEVLYQADDFDMVVPYSHKFVVTKVTDKEAYLSGDGMTLLFDDNTKDNFTILPKEENAKDEVKRIYIDVPFADKDEAKSLGAKYDAKNRQWYIEGSEKPEKFSKWKTLGPEPIKKQKKKDFNHYKQQSKKKAQTKDSKPVGNRNKKLAYEL